MGVRVAALYDVHANLPALDAVLAESDLAGADVVICGHTHLQFDFSASYESRVSSLA